MTVYTLGDKWFCNNTPHIDIKIIRGVVSSQRNRIKESILPNCHNKMDNVEKIVKEMSLCDRKKTMTIVGDFISCSN